MSDASNTNAWATRYDPAAEHKAIVDQLTAECAAEHERADAAKANAARLWRILVKVKVNYGHQLSKLLLAEIDAALADGAGGGVK